MSFRPLQVLISKFKTFLIATVLLLCILILGEKFSLKTNIPATAVKFVH